MRIRVVLPAAAWTAAAAIGPAAAWAHDAAPGTGGAPSSLAVRVDALSCRSACDATGAVAPGGLVRLHGRGLAGAVGVVFAGRRSAPAVRARPSQADVRVPAGAVTGPVRVAPRRRAVAPPRPAPPRI